MSRSRSSYISSNRNINLFTYEFAYELTSIPGKKKRENPIIELILVSNCHGLVFALAWTCLDLPQPAKEASNRSSRGGWSDDECAARQGSMIPLFFSPPREKRPLSET